MKMDRIQKQNIVYTWHEKIGQSRIAVYWNTGEEKLFWRGNFSFYSHEKTMTFVTFQRFDTSISESVFISQNSTNVLNWGFSKHPLKMYMRCRDKKA